MARGQREIEEPYDFGTILRDELIAFSPGRFIRKRMTDETSNDYARYMQSQAADDRERLSAICLSGGGIRSAAFALGALQGLARYQVLGQFHYLSTVSGGGYIGSWLTAWRHEAQIRGGGDTEVYAGLDQLRRTGEEAPQIRGLRSDSNYLTPRYGFLSPDTWAVLALVTRNLVLNWLVFAPLFLCILMVPIVARSWIADVHQAAAGQRMFYATAGAAMTVFAGINSLLGRWRRRGRWITTTRFVLQVLLPAILAASSFTLAAAAKGPPQVLWWLAGGIVLYAASWLATWLFGGRTRQVPEGTVTWWLMDLFSWMLAGTCVGAMLGLGVYLAPILAGDDSGSLLAVLGVQWSLLSVFVGELVFVAVSSFVPDTTMNREWLARAGGMFAAAATSWSLLSAVALYSPVVLPWIAHRMWALLSALTIGSVSGALTLVVGAGGKTPAVSGQAQPTNPLWSLLPSAAAVIFALFLAALLALVNHALTGVLLAQGWLDHRATLTLMLSALALAAVAFIASCFINVNRFSLHALYRNRLVRAFLGSARQTQRRDEEEGGADPFTGFSGRDNPYLAELTSSRPNRLLHVINIALNVVNSRHLAWQERKAESFTVTRLASGNEIVGYRRTADYGSKRGLTLGTAMAISGAAVSPNMGYHSSPVVGFLLMLFNLRLGWWLGNPKKDNYRKEGPQPGLLPELNELAGATTDDKNWVYLSDGGHFDNLGLYEMVKRRCHTIVVIDAGADQNYAFEDLGNALRKAFIDQGVGIDFGTFTLQPRQEPPARGIYCAKGTIHYPGDATPGWLLYIKPGYHGDEQVDIRNYASEHRDFPHESTLDQWFSESQFEAYRSLGAHILEEICAGGLPRTACGKAPSSIEDFGRLERMVDTYIQRSIGRGQASARPRGLSTSRVKAWYVR